MHDVYQGGLELGYLLWVTRRGLPGFRLQTARLHSKDSWDEGLRLCFYTNSILYVS